jgi:uncharacterized surface anchored protein
MKSAFRAGYIYIIILIIFIFLIYNFVPRAKWVIMSPTSYSVTVEFSQSQVENGRVINNMGSIEIIVQETGITYNNLNSVVLPEVLEQIELSIDGLFDVINKNCGVFDVDDCIITYNERYGYPCEISIWSYMTSIRITSFNLL